MIFTELDEAPAINMSDHAQCGDFTTINDFLQNAVAGSVNITEAVGRCPETCGFIWGGGNPDLSGIGVSHKL